MRASSPMPLRDEVDVRADLLADVRDLVDERDLGREECVRGMLDHLGRGHVGDQLGAAEAAVERSDAPADGGLLGADDDAVGALEVGDRAALAQELRVRRVARRRAARARRASGAGARPCPAGTVDFITSTTSSVSGGMASITASTRLRSASPEALGGVSTHTNAIAARANSSAADDVNVQPLAPGGEHAPRCPARGSAHRPARRRSSFASSMSRQTTLVARLREARSRDEPDVADADDAEPLCRHASRPAFEDQAGDRWAGTRLCAIAIMVSGDSLSSSELSIQTTTPPAVLQGWPP